MLKRTFWMVLLIGLLGLWGCHAASQMSIRAGYYGGYPYEPLYVDPYDRFYAGPSYYPMYLYQPYPFFYDPFYDPFFFGADFFDFPCCAFNQGNFGRPGRSLHGFRGGGGGFSGSGGFSSGGSGRSFRGGSLR